MREKKETIERRLRSWANGIRGLYGAPVYLVGSALRRGNTDPRDYDVRVVLSNAEFARRYGGDVFDWEHQGGSGQWRRVRWRWSDDCVKQSRIAFANTRLNIDFQVQPRSHANALYGKRPRVRLDTRGRR